MDDIPVGAAWSRRRAWYRPLTLARRKPARFLIHVTADLAWSRFRPFRPDLFLDDWLAGFGADFGDRAHHRLRSVRAAYHYCDAGTARSSIARELSLARCLALVHVPPGDSATDRLRHTGRRLPRLHVVVRYPPGIS